MTDLRDHVSVARSVDEAQTRLDAYLASLRGKDGVARMRLRVPIVADGYQLSIDREVRVEAERARDNDNLNDLIRISWRPEGSVVFPVFEGTLVVWSEDDPQTSFIELDGGYKPPFGAAGQVFDSAIGHRIAEQTARQLLNDLKAAVERS
jgi:hypothetical protein